MSYISKKVIFMGEQYPDFLFYSAAAINNLNMTVCIVDLTKNRRILECVPGMEDSHEWTCNGIDFLDNNNAEGYDVVCIYTEDIDNIDDIDASDIVLNTSVSKKDVDIIKKISDISANKIVILRDVISSSYGKKYLTARLECNLDNVYQINIDVIDYGYRIDMDYEGYYSFKNLSLEYCKVVAKVMTYIFDIEEKKVLNAVRRAREGKIIENSCME